MNRTIHGRAGGASANLTAARPVRERSPSARSRTERIPALPPLVKSESSAAVPRPRTQRPAAPARPSRTKGTTRTIRSPRSEQPKKRSEMRKKVKAPVVVRERERLAKFDMPLMLTIIVLLVFGLVMLLSASSSLGQREYGDNYHFFSNQLWFVLAGIAAMIVVSYVPYHIFLNRRILTLLAVVTVVMMVMVLTPIGVSQGGAKRWLAIGPVQFQPSEILKFTLIIVLAYITHKYHDYLSDHKKGVSGFVLFCGIIGVACALTVFQPHLSGTIIIFAIGLSLMVVSTVRFRYVGIAIGLMILALVIGPTVLRALNITHFEARLLSWKNPEADITGDTLQTYQSLVTIGSGGWFGLGLGNSRQKFSYLPATNNDFVFPIICEELGFVGGALVLILFVVFVLRGFYIASHARDRFGMMVAAGITTQVGLQAFLNIAVVTNSIPNTGITLPFFSYGGTAMLVLLAELGVLLNISRKAKIE